MAPIPTKTAHTSSPAKAVIERMGRTRLAFLWLLCCVLYHRTLGQTSPTADPLHTQVTLSYSNASLYEILTDIQETYQIPFFYSEDLLPLEQKRSVNIRQQSLEEALRLLFQGTSIDYQQVGKHIVLFQGKEHSEDIPTQPVPEKGTPSGGAVISKVGKKAGPVRQWDPKTLKRLRKWKRRYEGPWYRQKHPVPDTTSLASDTAEKKKSNTRQSINTIVAKGKQSPFSLSFQMALGHSFRKLTSSNPEGKDILKQRNVEKPGPAYSLELLGTYAFRPSFLCSGGLGYATLGEKGQYNDGQAYATHLHALSVPLYAAYQYQPRDAFLKMAIGLHPSWVLSSQDDLQYNKLGKKPPPPPPAGGPPAPVPQASAPQAYRPFNVAFSLRAEVGYPWKQWGFSAGMQYMQYLRSVYPSSAPVQEIDYFLGFSFGIRYQF